jgi:hypothetical protein
MDRCKVELDEIYEKYRDMCKERSNKDEKWRWSCKVLCMEK